ncbi:MAG: ThiF family adenylyltransferase [Campylobacterota bacterium]|nr:ThiF family adenylyltransferase [Campylobacterota bacterium]
MTYEEIYQRNIGLFTQEEQDKLRNAKVAVAGVGGVGSYQAVALARLGIGELSIMDPGVFDPPDMNRQYGAMASTMDINKASATEKILKDISPHLKITTFTSAAKNRDELNEFIKDADIVIDAIDYAGFDYKQMLHECSREAGLYVLSGPIPAYGASMQIFSPTGMSIEDFYGAPKDREKWAKYRLPISVIAPKDVIPDVWLDFEHEKISYLSTNGASAQLAGSLLGMEIALIITGKRKEEELTLVPDMVFVDLLRQEYRKFNPLEI